MTTRSADAAARTICGAHVRAARDDGPERLAGVLPHEAWRAPAPPATAGSGSRSAATTWSASTCASKHAPERGREPERQLGVRATPDRHQDALDLGDAALLDDGDVTGRVAHDLVDGGAEHGLVAVRRGRPGAAAPAEDDEVRLVLGGQLHDALRGAPPDAHHGPQVDATRARTPAPAAAVDAPVGPGSRPRTVTCPRAPPRWTARSGRHRAPAAPRRYGRGRPRSEGWPAG